MTSTFNATTKAAIYAVFTDADKSSASFAERLFKLGVGDRATAKPLAMAWAAQKYGVAIEQGQRGDRLPRDSAAEKAMNRVLAVCFPAVDLPESKAKANAKTVSAVEKLLAAYLKLDGAEKRSFKAQLAKL
jgi:hypothetical protein